MSTSFNRLIFTDDKGDQWRLTISEFRDTEYLHIRKYYQDLDGEWQPTKTGAAFKLTINNSFSLFMALAEVLSSAECSAVDIHQFLDEYERTNDTTISTESLRSLLCRSSDN